MGEWMSAGDVERSDVIAHWIEYHDREEFREAERERRKGLIDDAKKHFQKPKWAK
jgi:hypothetical protein